MNQRFSWVYIIYLIISSFFVDIEHQNILLHFLNIIPTILLLYCFFQNRTQPYSVEDYFILIPLTIFPLSETIIYFFTKQPDEPLIIILNGIYFFMIHLSFIIIYRMEGGRLLTFTNTDYYKIFPIAIATFLVFGFIFLPIIPGKFIFLMMVIATLLAILLAHIINRPIRGKSYFFALAGGGFMAITDFFAGYSTFFVSDPKFYILYRFTYFLGLFCLITSLIYKKKAFRLYSQKEFFAEHKQQKQPFDYQDTSKDS
jgi:hypothetical protein